MTSPRRPRIVLVLLLIAVSAGVAPADRVDRYDTAASALDAGRIDLAPGPPPLSVEMADLLIEAGERSCALDSVLAALESGPFAAGAGDTPTIRYLRAHRTRSEPRLVESSSQFRDAGAAFMAVPDTLAAVICLVRSARAAVTARESGRALEALETLDVVLERFRTPGRIREAAVLMRGETLLLADRLDEAGALLERAYGTAEEKGHRGIRCRALQALGKLAEKRQHFDDAAGYYRDALADARVLRSTERIAKLLNDFGQSEIRLGRLDTARESLDDSYRLARSCGADWVLGYVYYGMGALAEAENDLDSATEYFRRSIDLHGRLGNTWSELGARLRLAYRLLDDARYRPAIGQYERCLAYYDSTGSRYGAGWALGGLALAHHRLGHLSAAADYYERAYEVRSRLGDRRGAAWCLNSLGMVHDMRANYREAFDYQHRALEIYEEIGDRRGLGSVHFGIGSVYFYLGNYGKSLEHYEIAHAIATELGDVYLLQTIASGMSSVYQNAGRPDLAEKFGHECLRSAKDTGQLVATLWALNNLAAFYLQTGDTTRARTHVEEAVALLPDDGLDHVRARTTYLRGKTERSRPAAIARLERAARLARSNGLREQHWKYLSDLGELYRLEGDGESAARCLERAIGEIEALRRGVGSDELRRHMLRPAITPYERMVALILGGPADPARVRDAYAYVERSKAQIFAALLQDARARTEFKNGDERESRDDLVSRLSHCQSLLQDGSLDRVRKQQLLDEIDLLERKLLRREVRLAGRGENYAAAYAAPVDVENLLESLHPSERLLSYFLGANRSWLFTSRGGRLDMFELPGRETIERKAAYYTRLLHQQATGGEGTVLPEAVIDAASAELYDILIGPVADRLEPGETLVLAPDGLLNRLPFALLKHGESRLVDRQSLFFTPSLQSLYYLRRRSAARASAGAENGSTLVAIGCSGIRPGDDRSRRVYPFTNIAIEPLPNAATEARTIARMFPDSKLLVGGDAGEDTILEGVLDAARLVHVAAHSYVDNEDVRRSFIVLNPPADEGNTPDRRIYDGLLQWHEIAAMNLDASLVTLSACRAAGGVLAFGEGVTGLSQAFLYAGGGCVLASFIDVPDRFAGRFMTAFYRYLLDGATGAEALRSVQCEAMGWTDTARGPAQWGAFALVGDGNFTLGGP